MMPETMLASELAAKMMRRTRGLLKMKEQNLSVSWLQKFSLQELENCCDRMSALLPENTLFQENCQQELIRNPAFAAYYVELMPMFPQATPQESAPAVACERKSRRNTCRTMPVPTSRRDASKNRLSELLEQCWENGLDITAYDPQDLMDALEVDGVEASARLVYLECFAPKKLSSERKQVVFNSLAACYKVPLRLETWQKELLEEAYVATRPVFCSVEFVKICELLQSCPELTEMFRFLHEQDICENLQLKDYKVIAQNAGECRTLLSSIVNQVGKNHAATLILYWQKGGCMIEELRRMNRRLAAEPDSDWDVILFNYSGYVNLLYGTQFKNIELSNIPQYQEDILIYAIVHHKKHFIRLVDEHPEKFLSLSSASLLLNPALYEEHFNLNTLMKKDLDACQWMRSNQLYISSFTPGRKYSFPELAALYQTPAVYVCFYNMLSSDNQDYRLRVFRQVRKRKILDELTEEELPKLAEMLSSKPLQDWREQELGHIDGLTAADAAKLLAHYNSIRHLIPGIRCRTDGILVLRNLEVLEQITSVAELKANITRLDAEWGVLAEKLQLSQEFIGQYQKNVILFLCRNGASIAGTYETCLHSDQREAFHRVVKAELMGKLHELKYFEGDLQRELDRPLTEQLKTGWQRNLTIEVENMKATEYDDFFSTMLLGTQPRRTCLSYRNGAYRECLLSAFDSNKKVLYVSLDGKIVGRAFLRLTKGRKTYVEGTRQKSSFTFVDLENVAGSRKEVYAVNETLTLFLERPYISGVNAEKAEQVQQLIELACRKADELGTMLVLSTGYDPKKESFIQTRFDIYISKSKAESQYLDSLDGPASVDREGSYRANTFLLREEHHHF